MDFAALKNVMSEASFLNKFIFVPLQTHSQSIAGGFPKPKRTSSSGSAMAFSLDE
jgi:hypothetical protein